MSSHELDSSTAAATGDPPNPSKPPRPPLSVDRDFLGHLEAYLAKRDGVDKILKICRYATKIILASSAVPEALPIHKRLKSFEASVGLSRKAFRLGKFVQDVNALRASSFRSREDLLLSVVAYGGEGLYYFVEQFVWLAKSGLIDGKHSRGLQTISAWAEFVGYLGSIWLKIRGLRVMLEEEACLISSIEIGNARGVKCGDEELKLSKVREKRMLKSLSTIQDVADLLMALADIRDGRGRLSAPIVVSSAGLLSALISTHKNWISC
uniref:Peroxisomal membrane protein 11A n=1 Tax=Kalanchoe fedtschenkoi TaxID=63787 RepID=A0A7N0UNT2_KALFE